MQTTHLRPVRYHEKIAFAAAWMLLMAAAACDPDQPCGSEETFADGVCMAASAPAPRMDGGSSDGGSDSDDGGSACTEAPSEALGKMCSDDAECTCAAPFCAKAFGTGPGTCTIPNCTVAPDSCPDGYTCFDLSDVGVSGYDPFCIEDKAK
jgi:hypothetical protein